MPSQIVRVFFTKEVYNELEERFVDEKGELLQFARDCVKVLAREAKFSKLNKQLIANIYNGPDKLKKKVYSLKKIDLSKYPVTSNSEWRPELLDKEDEKVYEIQIREKVWEYLELYYKLYCAKIDRYNEALAKTNDRDTKPLKLPTCIEAVLHEQIAIPLADKASQNIDKEFDQEFAEMDKEDKKKGTPEGTKGVRPGEK